MTAVQQPAQGTQPLIALMQEVDRARAYVAEGRARAMGTFPREDQHRRNRLLLSALEAYALGARSAGAPLPYRYRDDLRLLRGVYSSGVRDTAARAPR